MIQSKQADAIKWTLQTHRAYLDLLLRKDAVVNEEQINKMIFNNRTWLEELKGND